MSGITLVCLFALAQAINSVAISPEIDQRGNQACSRTADAFIIEDDVYGFHSTYTRGEAECAAYCWAMEACQFYTYLNGWCLPKKASTNTVPYKGATWGSRNCGSDIKILTKAPKECSRTEGYLPCPGYDIPGGITKFTSGEAACAAFCLATKGCEVYGYGGGVYGTCQLKSSATCTFKATKGTSWGTRCANPTNA